MATTVLRVTKQIARIEQTRGIFTAGFEAATHARIHGIPVAQARRELDRNAVRRVVGRRVRYS